MTAWLRAFAFTQIVEVPIWTWALEAPGNELWPWINSRKRMAVVGFGASCLTHPVVWFAFPTLNLPALSAVTSLCRSMGWSPRLAPYVEMVALAELFALVVEALYARAAGLRRAFAWSLLANGASFGLGLVSRLYFPGPWSP